MSIEVLPRDAHNERLVANVHPPDWINPEPAPQGAADTLSPRAIREVTASRR
jgi:hypothetical protein